MSDERFGIVVSARDAWPNTEELRALGARCVRTIVYDFDHLDGALRDHPPDVRVIAVLDPRQSGARLDPSDLSRWNAHVRAFGERFAGRVWALECLSNWDMLDIEASIVVSATRSAAQIVRGLDSRVYCLLGSVTGPRWVERLLELAHALTPADRDLIAGACLRPHRKNARGLPGFDHRRIEHGEIDIAVQDAHDIVQLPIWVTGFGIQLDYAGGETGQAQYLRSAFDLLQALPPDVLAAATYYCWSDATAAPHERGDHAFGLRREDIFDAEADMKPRLAWRAFAELAGGIGVPPALFSQPQSGLTPQRP